MGLRPLTLWTDSEGIPSGFRPLLGVRLLSRQSKCISWTPARTWRGRDKDTRACSGGRRAAGSPRQKDRTSPRGGDPAAPGSTRVGGLALW